jgi:hypothetical protein
VIAVAALAAGGIVALAEEDEPHPQVAPACRSGRCSRIGTLRIMDAEETVERLPGPSLLPTRFQGFERQPVLIATAVVGA